MTLRDDSAAAASWLCKRGKSKRPSLSRHSRADLALCFSLIDEDASGAIDSAELRVAFAALGVAMTKEQCVEEVKLVDRDGSGFVEFPEFVKMVASEKSASGERNKLRAAFVTDDAARTDPRVILNKFNVGAGGENMQHAVQAIRAKQYTEKGDVVTKSPTTKNRRHRSFQNRDERKTKTHSSFASWSANAQRSEAKISLATHFERPNAGDNAGDPYQMPFNLTAIAFKRAVAIARVYDSSRRVKLLQRDDETKKMAKALEDKRMEKRKAEARRRGKCFGVTSVSANESFDRKAGCALDVFDTAPETTLPVGHETTLAVVPKTTLPAVPETTLNRPTSDAVCALKSREALGRAAARLEKTDAKYPRDRGNEDFQNADSAEIGGYLLKLKRERRRFSMAFEDGAPLTTLDEKGFPIIAKGIGVSARQRGDEVRSGDETARVKRPVASKRNASSFAKTSAPPCAQTFVKKYELGVDLLVSSGDEDEASDAVRTTDGGRDGCESTASGWQGLCVADESSLAETRTSKGGKRTGREMKPSPPKNRKSEVPARVRAMRAAITRGFFHCGAKLERTREPFRTV